MPDKGEKGKKPRKDKRKTKRDHGPALIYNCPPGLAKKNPPCVPPGQAKKGRC